MAPGCGLWDSFSQAFPPVEPERHKRVKLAAKRHCMRHVASLIALFFLMDAMAFATIFGSVRGVVHDPQHRPIRSVQLTLKAQNSDWTQSQETNDNGEFTFTSVPIGAYTVTVTLKGFQEVKQDLILQSDTSPLLHFQLAVAGVNESVVVPEIVGAVTTDSVTPTTMVSRTQIQQTPGADRTNGMEMITDYVPATYMTHDMLHMMGGHQVNWLIDGVPIPNTNIATNLGPQILPETSTISRCIAAATTLTMATGLTESSTSSREPGLNAKRNAISCSPPGISTRPMTRLVAEGTATLCLLWQLERKPQPIRT